MSKKKKIQIKGLEIRIEPINDNDYVSLTDIAKQTTTAKPAYSIINWLNNSSTVQFLYTWEKLSNPKIKVVQIDNLIAMASNNRINLTPKKWIELTGAIGIYSRPVRGMGTFAHKDIALNFCYWLSPEFQVYMIKEFQRLKELEAETKNLKWHISKITDNVEELRNLLDTIPHQEPNRNRLNQANDNDKDQ